MAETQALSSGSDQFPDFVPAVSSDDAPDFVPVSSPDTPDFQPATPEDPHKYLNGLPPNEIVQQAKEAKARGEDLSPYADAYAGRVKEGKLWYRDLNKPETSLVSDVAGLPAAGWRGLSGLMEGAFKAVDNLTKAVGSAGIVSGVTANSPEERKQALNEVFTAGQVGTVSGLNDLRKAVTGIANKFYRVGESPDAPDLSTVLTPEGMKAAGGAEGTRTVGQAYRDQFNADLAASEWIDEASRGQHPGPLADRDVMAVNRVDGGAIMLPGDHISVDPENVSEMAPALNLTMLIPFGKGYKAASGEPLLAAGTLEQATTAGIGARALAATAGATARGLRSAQAMVESSPLIHGLAAAGVAELAGADPSQALLAGLLGANVKSFGFMNAAAGKVAGGLEHANQTLLNKIPPGPMGRFAASAAALLTKEGKSAVMGQLANTPFLLGAQSEDEFKDMLATGLAAHTAGYGLGAFTNGLSTARNYFSQGDRAPEIRLDVKDIGTDPELDAAHRRVVAGLNNGSSNFVQSIRDYFGKARGELYTLFADDYNAHIDKLVASGRISKQYGEDAKRQQGFTYTDEDADGNKRNIGLSRVTPQLPGLSVGHESGHLLELLLSPEELNHAYAEVKNSFSQEDLDAYKARHEALLNAGLGEGEPRQSLSERGLLSEIFAEHVSAVLNSIPVGKFGVGSGAKSFSRTVYGLVGRAMEKIGAKQPQLSPLVIPKVSTGIGIDPSIRLSSVIENIVQAKRLDGMLPGDTGPILAQPGGTPEGSSGGVAVSTKTETPAKIETATAEAPGGVKPVESKPVPGLKKGDPVDEVRNAAGVLVAEGAKISKDLGEVDGVKYFEIEYTDPDTGKRVTGNVPESWLQSKVTPGGVNTNLPATHPHPITDLTPPYVAKPAPAELPVPKQVENTTRPQAVPNVRTTPEAQNTFAAPATDEVHKANRDKLSGLLSGPRDKRPAVETDYYSAKSPVQAPDAAVREQQRLAADAAEKSGTPNPLRAIYQKVFVPYRWTPWLLSAEDNARLYGNAAPRAPGGVFGMSMDKVIQNVDLLRGALKLNPAADKALASFSIPEGYLGSDKLRGDIQRYLDNQAHGYAGDGSKLVRPGDTRAGSITPEDSSWNSNKLPPQTSQLINLLMGLEQQQTRTPGMEYAYRFAELNGNSPKVVGTDSKGQNLTDTNPIRVALKAAGVDPRILNTAIENLPTKNFTTPLKVRTDLHYPAGDTGIMSAGFMPDTSRVTETPEFKNWFGNSKVVDSGGKPKVVFHGTGTNFNTFHSGDTSLEGGSFFSSDKIVANKFARDSGGKPRVVSVFLKLENPLKVDSTDLYGLDINDLNSEEFEHDTEATADAISRAKEGGHDGVIFTRMPEYGRFATQYVAFRPEQIKSATENVGTFDSSNPDVRFMPDTVRRSRGNDETRTVAQSYMKFSGIQDEQHTGYAPADEVNLKKIADYYESASHNPDNPEVQKSYSALASETMQQYAAMERAGIKIEPFSGIGEPYKSSADMLRDVRDNKHLFFFLPTENAFGEDGQKPGSNPMLENSGVEISGHPLLVNDVFRAVHDYFGHTAEGYEFGPRGEYNAYLAHSRMFSDEAKPALAAETLAQNAWVNFGPHLRRADGSLPRAGEEGYVAPKDRKFAEQKNIVLPKDLTDSVDSPKFMPFGVDGHNFSEVSRPEDRADELARASKSWVSPKGEVFISQDPWRDEHSDFAYFHVSQDEVKKYDDGGAFPYVNALVKKGWLRANVEGNQLLIDGKPNGTQTALLHKVAKDSERGPNVDLDENRSGFKSRRLFTGWNSEQRGGFMPDTSKAVEKNNDRTWGKSSSGPDSWMDPNGQLHPVGQLSHEAWAQNKLGFPEGTSTEHGDASVQLHSQGWSRVVTERNKDGSKELFVNTENKLSRAQKEELTRLAIQHELRLVQDDGRTFKTLYSPPATRTESSGFMPAAEPGKKKDSPTGWVFPNGDYQGQEANPQGNFLNTGDWHNEFLKGDRDDLKTRFGFEFKNEGDDRKRALDRGFVRIRYDGRSGRIGVEARADKFTGVVKQKVEDVLEQNIGRIDRVDVNLFNKDGQIVRQSGKSVFSLSGQEKSQAVLDTLNDRGGAFMPETQRLQSDTKYWLDPKGKFHEADEHEDWAQRRLGENAVDNGRNPMANSEELFKKGWVRAMSDDANPDGSGFTMHVTQKEYGTPTKLTKEQRAKLEDLSFEGWKVQDSNTDRNNVIFKPVEPPKFMPEADPVEKAALRLPSGEILTAKKDEVHYHLLERAVQEGKLTEKELNDPRLTDGYDGFVTKSGKFLTRDEAMRAAVSSGQLDRADLGGMSESYLTKKSASLDSADFEEFRQFMPATPQEALDSFNKDTLKTALKRPGWAILTATQEALGDPNGPKNRAANKDLQTELTKRELPFKVVKGSYNGADQGKNFLVTGLTEKTAQALGKKYKQEAVLTNRGYVYQDGSVAPLKHGDTIIGDAAKKQPGYSVLPDGTPFSAGIDFGKRIQPDVRDTQSFKDVAKYLTPGELKDMQSNTTRNLIDAFNELPKDIDFETASKLGMLKRGWYQRAGESLRALFGDDTEKFVSLLAATSPQQSVQENLAMSFRTWRDWLAAGRPTDTSTLQRLLKPTVDLACRLDNGIRALQGRDLAESPEGLNKPMPPRGQIDAEAELSGNKVESFRRNLLGDLNAVTNDTWMAKFGEVDPKSFGNTSGYLAYSAKMRRVADTLGIKPAEVQETLWSFFRTLFNNTTVDRSSQAALAQMTPEDIINTPEFAHELLTNPKVRDVLKELHAGPEGEAVLARLHDLEHTRPVPERTAGQGLLASANLGADPGSGRALARIVRRAQALKDAEVSGEKDTRASNVTPDDEDNPFMPDVPLYKQQYDGVQKLPPAFWLGPRGEVIEVSGESSHSKMSRLILPAGKKMEGVLGLGNLGWIRGQIGDNEILLTQGAVGKPVSMTKAQRAVLEDYSFARKWPVVDDNANSLDPGMRRKIIDPNTGDGSFMPTTKKGTPKDDPEMEDTLAKKTFGKYTLFFGPGKYEGQRVYLATAWYGKERVAAVRLSEGFTSENMWTLEDHQRKGIMTALMNLAEETEGADVTPSEDRTSDAKQFWISRRGFMPGTSMPPAAPRPGMSWTNFDQPIRTLSDQKVRMPAKVEDNFSRHSSFTTGADGSVVLHSAKLRSTGYLPPDKAKEFETRLKKLDTAEDRDHLIESYF